MQGFALVLRDSLQLVAAFAFGVGLTLAVITLTDGWYTYSVSTASTLLRNGLPPRCQIVNTFGTDNLYAQVRCARWGLP